MPEAPVCPTHPTDAVVGSCTRCGTFVCAHDSRLLEGKPYCATCAARPDVDWLEAFKHKHWGVRDGWAWLFGISAPLQLLAALGMLAVAESRPLALFVIASAVGGALWWLKISAARWLIVAVLLAQAAFVAATVHPATLLANLIPLLILASVATSTRTKLFFELEVTHAELHRMWDIYANNLIARYALSLGIVGLLFWPFAPLAVLCGVIGLLRVDLSARPPIGRRGSAIAGLVLGLVGVGIATTFIVGNLR